MKVSALFAVSYGNKLDMNKMRPDSDGVNFVGRSRKRNGVSGRVAIVEGVTPFATGLLTVALGGASRLETFVQQEPFYTAQNVAVLKPKTPMTTQEALYWAMCIRANRYRYEGFGREANRTLSTLELPDNVPEWASQVEVPDYQAIAVGTSDVVALPPVDEWQAWRLDALFEIKKGKRRTSLGLSSVM